MSKKQENFVAGFVTAYAILTGYRALIGSENFVQVVKLNSLPWYMDLIIAIFYFTWAFHLYRERGGKP